MSNEKLLLTVKDVCERLSLGKTVIYARLQDGSLEGLLVGRSRRFTVAALAKFVELQRAEQGFLPVLDTRR
jgi:excisionase family DNA binding protein